MKITPSGKEYLDFLIDEINSAHPRGFLLETITRSFRNYLLILLMNYEAT